MKIKVTSDHGRIGPVVWYNQQPIHYYTHREDTNRYEWSPQIAREGAGITYLVFGDVDIPLDFRSLWDEFIWWWCHRRSKYDLDQYVEFDDD